MTLNIAVIVTLLLTLMGSGVYIGLAMAGVGVVALHFMRHLGSAVGAVLYNAVDSYPMAAIPLFLFLGQLVLHSGLSGRLYEGVSKFTRIIPGGLLHSNILSCAIFAAVSGSSTATAATIGTVAYREQKERGYKPSIITGSLAAGGTLGILIPPSINMILYGAFVGASVGRLFAGGIVPGIILASMFMIYIGFANWANRSLGPPPERLTRDYFPNAITALKDIFPMFLIIVVIMGSIYGGIMTPTEAAAASAFLGIILGAAFGKMNFTVLKDSAVEALRATAMCMLLYIGGNILGSAMGLLRLPAQLAEVIGGLGLTPMWIWFIIVIFYLILGCFMDALSMMLVTLAVTYPLIFTFAGFDPIWFGVQLVILAEIGAVTPPVGLNLFIIQGVSNVDLWTIIRGVFPFFLLMLAILALCTFFPELVLFLPAHMLG